MYLGSAIAQALCEARLARSYVLRWSHSAQVKQYGKNMKTIEHTWGLITCIPRPLSFCLAKDSCRGHSASKRPCTSCSDSQAGQTRVSQSHAPWNATPAHDSWLAVGSRKQHWHPTQGGTLFAEMSHKATRLVFDMFDVNRHVSMFGVLHCLTFQSDARRHSVEPYPLHICLSWSPTTIQLTLGTCNCSKCCIEQLDNNETIPFLSTFQTFCTCHNVRYRLEQPWKSGQGGESWRFRDSIEFFCPLQLASSITPA